MELDILPATVYKPSPGPAPRRALNTIVEESQVGEGTPPPAPTRSDKADDRTTQQLAVPSHRRAPAAYADPVPGFRVSVSSTCSSLTSSTVDSRSLTWMSTATGSTIDTSTDIDDLADAMGREADDGEDIIKVVFVGDPVVGADGEAVPEPTPAPPAQKPRYPSLLIPSAHSLRARGGFKNDLVVPPTPPPKIPLSPAMLSLLMESRPGPSAPPSLDGSLTSEQLAGSDAPLTPSVGTPDDASPTWGQGVQLNDEALATLHAISDGDQPPMPESNVEPPHPYNSEVESEPEPDIKLESELTPSVSASSRRHTYGSRSQSSGRFRASVVQLDIPSPGGFFPSLGAGTRRTWCPNSANPLSSTTAERFYTCPWEDHAVRTSERVLVLDDLKPDEPETARRIPHASLEPSASVEEVEAVAAVDNDDMNTVEDNDDDDDDAPDGAGEHRNKEVLDVLSPAKDRIASWLSTQQQQPDAPSVGELAVPFMLDVPHGSTSEPRHQAHRAEPEDWNKAVVLPETQLQGPAKGVSELSDSTFWRVFSALFRVSHDRDVFVHRQERYDSLFSKRVVADPGFYDGLTGRFVMPSVRPVKDVFDDEPDTAAREAAKLELERKVARLLAASHWHIMAIRYLNGGRLLTTVGARMLRAPSEPLRIGAAPPRLLDLGGVPVADWAWQCAHDHPTVEIHTLPASALPPNTHPDFRGPRNHFVATAPRMWALPFPDEHFDVISARSVYMHLKAEKPVGEELDEYDLCLRECLRCLRPGGCLEFSVLDSELLDAGPRGTAMSVEFGFKLRTRGYDPSPTRSWLQRIEKAGFVDVNRMWTFLPMGVAYATASETKANGAGAGVDDKRARPINVDAVTGLVGLRAWEQWMLLLQTEISPDVVPFPGIVDVVVENRKGRAGWKCLSGFARKPMP